jgi:hypothetical protein
MPKFPKSKAIAHPRHEEPPSWSWEEHVRQPYQRAEHMEHTVGIVMGVVAVLIAAAMAARLIAPYFGYNF